jgi:hypothetical protein
MVSPELEAIARRAEQIYDERLRAQLEPTHRGWIVAIEPDSGDYFLGRTLEEASAALEKVHPSKVHLSYALRVGFPSVYEIGYSHDDGTGG